VRPVHLIVIHCSATADGRALARDLLTAAQVIDGWHADRNFHRAELAQAIANPHLPHVGYHYVIDALGGFEQGRMLAETGAHAAGFNEQSISICMVGSERYSLDQWSTLRDLVTALARSFEIPLRAPEKYTIHRRAIVTNGICGHRDLSPDQNANGIVEPFEWLKTCPGFDVAAWLANELRPLADHTYDPEHNRV